MKIKTKVISIALILSVSIIYVSCGQKEVEEQISITNLKIMDVDIISTKTFQAHPLGVDFGRKEIYFRLSSFYDDPHTIGIVDIQTGEIIRSFNVRKGGFETPGDFYNPTYMRFLDNRYFVVDWFFKILAFDNNLTYLYTTMFRDSKLRYFFDFYEKNGEQFFVIGEKKSRPKESICSVEIYKMIEKRNLELHKKILEIRHKSLFYTWPSKRTLFGQLWSSSWGFEKDGKIYFANSAERKYYVYDLNQRNLESVQLNYLKGKKFADDDARRIRYEIFKSGDYFEDLERKYNKEYVDIAYPEELYYFGFYDVGENKLGIAGDLDLEGMSFRLDIIKVDSREYLESLCLPVGGGFFRHLSSGDRGLYLTQVNVDKGIYVWIYDDSEDDLFPFVKLNRFKIIDN